MNRISFLICILLVLFLAFVLRMLFLYWPVHLINIAGSQPLPTETKLDPFDRFKVEDYVWERALEFGVNPAMALYVLRTESANFNPNVMLGLEDGDMKIFCDDGSPVRARGIAQITKCHHPHIPDWLTYDVEWSIDFFLQSVVDGNANWWTAWRTWKRAGGL